MGNYPSEYYGCKCYKCNTSLPPCKTWDDLSKNTCDGRNVYEYNKGQYYREVGRDGCSECPDCFWKPKRERTLAERRRQEERKRQEEERKRQEEINEKLQSLLKETEKFCCKQKVENDILHQIDGETKSFQISLKEFEQERREKKRTSKEDLLEILSTKLNTDISSFELQKLSFEQVDKTVQLLRELLLDWTKEAPSQNILEQVQVFIIELIVGSWAVDKDTSLILQVASELHDLIQTISDSAQSINECLHLTQALFNLFQYELDPFTTPSNAVMSHLATTWSKGGILIKDTILLNFLEPLLKNLQDSIDGNLSTNSEQICFELLIKKAMIHWNGEYCTDITEKLLGLVHTHLWSPSNVIELLRILNDKQVSGILILKILHLVEIYRVSDKWKDTEGKTLTQTVQLDTPEIAVKNLDSLGTLDDAKTLDEVLSEIREENWIDEIMANKIRDIVTHVQVNLKEKPALPKGVTLKTCINDYLSTKRHIFNELQELLELLCRSLYEVKGWWPRVTQMVSWTLLALTDSGKLLEVATGEGKSCVIAMFAAFRVLKGQKIDVVSSSSVLSQRDAENWKHFYSLFNITVDTNTDKTEDENRYRCYHSDIVYGTVEAFAADYLRQNFEMKQIFPEPRFQCIIMDEVDSPLVDRGLQFTYLSSDMPGMQHLGPILAMTWSSVGQYAPIGTKTQTFLRGPPLPFYTVLYEWTDIEDPMQILEIAKQKGLLPPGFTEDLSGNQNTLKNCLSTINQETMLKIVSAIEEYIPYKCVPYTLDDKGILKRYSDNEGLEETDKEIPDLPVLITKCSLCCALYDADENISNAVAEKVKEHIQFTPCDINTDAKLCVPGFLKNLVEKKLQTWVENAFVAIQLQEGREYMVQGKQILPVDFKGTGVVESNKKWGDGLQQFLEMKHHTKVSTLSSITNFISSLKYFSMYNGQIYGTTGTLGTESDLQFLRKLYPRLSVCRVPTFNRKKLFEVQGLIKPTKEEWENTVCSVVQKNINPTSYRESRAVLVICEDINKAKDLYELIKDQVHGQVRQYTRNDEQHGDISDFVMNPGDVIIATNLAGRGTDIKVPEAVTRNGGLFVVLTFLSQNARVELQAFGRTARRGQPGSAQVIICSSHIPPVHQSAANIDELKDSQDYIAKLKVEQIIEDELPEVTLREKLFMNYCCILYRMYNITNEEDKKVAVATMNEYWGTWLQIKSKEIVELKEQELLTSLDIDINQAEIKSQSSESPLSSIYHYIKFGNNLLSAGKIEECAKLLQKAMDLDSTWAAIAFYNHAYCTLKLRKENYLEQSIKDLEKSRESLKMFKEQCLLTVCLLQLSSSPSNMENKTQFQNNMHIKLQVLDFFETNILKSIEKLQKIKAGNRDAVAVESSVFSLGTERDTDVSEELYEFFKIGLLNVFSVEEKPRFCWEGLLVFLLGKVEIVGGALLNGLTGGTLSNFGIALVSEGISDCIDGITSMVTGEFSWTSWSISKAISIGVSLTGSGIGKLMKKGFKGRKTAIKGFVKDLKGLPKMLSREVRGGYTTVMKENMRNAFKYVGKEMVQQTVMYGIGKAEEAVLNAILKTIETKIQESMQKTMRQKIEENPLRCTIDRFVLSQSKYPQQLKLVLDPKNCNSLKHVFSTFVNAILAHNYSSLGCQNQWFSALLDVIRKAKTEVQGNKQNILRIIEATYLSTLCMEAIKTVSSLVSDFVTKLDGDINDFLKEKEKQTLTAHDLTEENKESLKQLHDLTEENKESLKQFRETLADSMSKELAALFVQSFHQIFSGQLVKLGQSAINQYASKFIRKLLKTDSTIEKLKDGSASLYITYMSPETASEEMHPANKACLDKYIEKIKQPHTEGSVLDLRILSEATGTQVIVLEVNKNGELQKKHVFEPISTSPTNTISLVYHPASKDYPGGHYDALIKNEICEVRSDGKSCMFHAFAQALEPDAGDSQLSHKAMYLRELEAKMLRDGPFQWNGFLERKMLTEKIRGGDWFMSVGAASLSEQIERLAKQYRPEELQAIISSKIGEVNQYKENKKTLAGFGALLNAGHQPPLSCVLNACNVDENTISPLAKAMLKMALGNTDTSKMTLKDQFMQVKKNKGSGLLTVIVPYDLHMEFLTTGNSHVAKKFRSILTDYIKENDVVNVFKHVFIGSQTEVTQKMINPSLTPLKPNLIKQIDAATGTTQSFRKQQHNTQLKTTNMKLLQICQKKLKGIMTNDHFQELKTYINEERYLNKEDPYYTNLLNRIG